MEQSCQGSHPLKTNLREVERLVRKVNANLRETKFQIKILQPMINIFVFDKLLVLGYINKFPLMRFVILYL